MIAGLLDLLVSIIQFAFSVGSYVLAIGLFWHLKRIGKTGIARFMWWLLLAYVLFTFPGVIISDAVSYGNFNPLLLAVSVVIVLLILAAPFYNPLRPRIREQDSTDDGEEFVIPDRV